MSNGGSFNNQFQPQSQMIPTQPGFAVGAPQQVPTQPGFAVGSPQANPVNPYVVSGAPQGGYNPQPMPFAGANFQQFMNQFQGNRFGGYMNQNPQFQQFMQQLQDWRSQRPEMVQDMNRQDFRQQIQDWRSQRPELRGLLGAIGG